MQDKGWFNCQCFQSLSRFERIAKVSITKDIKGGRCSSNLTTFAKKKPLNTFKRQDKWELVNFNNEE